MLDFGGSTKQLVYYYIYSDVDLLWQTVRQLLPYPKMYAFFVKFPVGDYKSMTLDLEMK